MSFSANDLKAYLSATPTTSMSPPTPSIGGTKGATEFAGAGIAELHCVMASAIAGGGTRVQIAKYFISNENSTVDYTNATQNLKNSLDDSPAGPFVPSFQPLGAGEDNTFKCRFIGFDMSGNPLQSEAIASTNTLVPAGDSFGVLSQVESRDVTTGVLKATTQDWAIKCGSTDVGILAKSYYSATSEVQIGLVPTLDDTTTTTDASTLPAGITFSKPRTIATGLPFANSGVLTHGTSQGGWSKWAIPEVRKASTDIQVVIQLDGNVFD